ncbi:MAG: PAS domain-containing protein [Acidobacteriaceae bacterium]
MPAQAMLGGMNSSSGPVSPNNSASASQSRILGEGEMADRIRAFDWSKTSLGPIESWSNTLVTIVNLTLSFSSPARTMWGPELILIYNDAYRSFPGPRHPAALGMPAKQVYGESWPVVGPLLESAVATGKTLFYEKLMVPLPTADGMRNSYLNYSFNPILDGGKIAGLFGSLHDVTNEVSMTQSLRESEDRLSRILKSIGDAVIVTDAETSVVRMNPVAEQLTGWPLAEAEGKPLAAVFRIVNETTRLTVESPADKVRQTGSVVGLANHTVLIAKDGKETAIDDSGAPILDDLGQLNGIVLVFRDIEEKRAAEREKERITERLSQFLGATTDAIVGVDRNWVMTYVNPRANEMYAAGRQLVGQTVWEAFPNAAYEGSPFVEYYERAMYQGIPGGFDAHYAEPINRALHIEVYPTAEGIVTFSRDITQEIVAREALREKSQQAERRLAEIESLYRTAPIGLALFDTKDYRYLRLNDLQAAFFGLKPEQVVGRTLTEMAPIEGLRELFDQVRDGQPVINFPLEGELVTDPGTHRYWTVSYYPVLAADGSVQAITAASLEVTAQKKGELALIQSEKLAVVGRMAASIAHEINNPLESVTNLIYLAERSNDLGEIKEFVQTAERELRRVSAIANQTLRFHRQSSSPQAITAALLMESVVVMFQSRLVNVGIEVEQRQRAAQAVSCFEGEIRQVLSNLVSNAIDVMAHQGGRMLLRSRVGTHWPTGRRGVVMTVADTGEGMAEAAQEHIFEPFYTTKGANGTGLGLWVSSEIVARHQGALRFRSSQRKGSSGTVFSVFLPFDAVSRQTPK